MASNYNRRENSSGSIPPRWLECPRKSALLVGSRFLAFKTPLSHKFDEQVPMQNQFTPSLLFSSMKSYKVKIGLWIDLTNTSRFYDRSEVENEGAKYVKIQCKGRGECPTEEQVNTFVELCDKFIRRQPNDVIAVHCTHGFNRTGFMISSYFVIKEDWSCAKAVSEFAHVRPPGIYKQHYLDELFSRLDDPNDVPVGPPLPDWCQEESDRFDDDDDDQGAHNDRNNFHNKGGRSRPERFKKDSTFMEGVPGVSLVTEHSRRISIQRRIKEMCGWNSNGFPGCQPISMTVENLRLLSTKPYKVSWKADGTRYMMFIDGQTEVYFADRDFSIFRAPDVDFREKHDLRNYLCDTLVDGEMVIDVDRKTGSKYPRYLIYDAIRIHGKDIVDQNFHMRFERIMTDIISPRQAAIEKGLINKAREPFGIRRKDFWDANAQTTAKLLSPGFKQQLAHEPDGLIFQPEPDPYTAGRCDHVLKWKPSTLNSVDFRVKIVTQKGLGLLTTMIAELYVGGLNTPYSTMKATKAVKELNGKIIECKLQGNNWALMRERTDKSFPNSLATAQAVVNSIIHPVTEKMLLDFIHTNGYKRPDSHLMPPPPKRLKT